MFENNRGEYTAYVDKWTSEVSAIFVQQVKSVFNTHSEVRFEYWPQFGQVIIWEPGYEDIKWPLSVHVHVKNWETEYIEILDSESDEETEKRAALQEFEIISKIKPSLERELATDYKIKYFRFCRI